MPNANHGNQLSNDDYRYESISMGLMFDDMRFSKNGVQPGQIVPNFDVFTTEGEKLKLYDLSAGKPLLLVTGSLTCPMTISSIPSVSDLHRKLGDKVNIVLVYVREAHPGEKVPQPKSLAEKIEHAMQLKKVYGTQFPIIVDGIDGELHRALDIMPNSAHLIDRQGKLLFRSLSATDNASLEQALAAINKREPLKKTQSQRLLVPILGSAGFMNGTFTVAGARAHREMIISALPVYLLSLTSSLFFFLPEHKRGAMGLITMLSAAAIGAWAIYRTWFT
ncbi:MAG: redoxin domain-containing protein [Kordiimonadaceae bacterium]|nr:redoxin domain-containing protein [Kordiimonadaceae bacterium]MBO6568468.1 redoxin domain-containing protein [Kordiimonadaceae bacterium]MBO6963803.1 redoxin domain-containing protein [Kordiimonadaceae bacterium]